MQPTALAGKAGLDRARTSRAVTSLVGKGLVSRRVVSTGQRLAQLELTAAGQSLYAAMFPLVAAINQELVRELSEADRLALDQALLRIQHNAEQQLRLAELPRADRRHGRGRERTGASRD